MLPRRLVSRVAPARSYNFASSQYKECFGNGLPIADGVKLRADTVAYLDTFDPKVSWPRGDLFKASTATPAFPPTSGLLTRRPPTSNPPL